MGYLNGVSTIPHTTLEVQFLDWGFSRSVRRECEILRYTSSYAIVLFESTEMQAGMGIAPQELRQRSAYGIDE